MSDMPERITAWNENFREDDRRWMDAKIGHGGTEYVRADLYESLMAALEQALDCGWPRIPKDGEDVSDKNGLEWDTPGAVVSGDYMEYFVVAPELAAYLREKDDAQSKENKTNERTRTS